MVGYTGDEIVAGNFNMMTVPFMGTDGEGFKLNYHFNFPNVTGAKGSGNADQIQIWNPITSGYDIFFYYQDDSHKWDGWTWFEDSDYMFEDVYEEGLQPGSTFWYIAKGSYSSESPTANPSTVNGQVPTDTYDVDIVAGNFNMLAYPYPTPLFLNNKYGQQIEFVGVTGAKGSGNADQIQIWDARTSGYDIFFYYQDDSHKWDGWTWFDDSDYMFEDVYEDGLPVGRPFWYIAKGTYSSESPTTWKCNYTSNIAK